MVALVAANAARSVCSLLARQHCLYFLPLPQTQGSFRPVLAISATLAYGWTPCTKLCWKIPDFTACFWPSIGTLLRLAVWRDVRGAAVCSIRPCSPASPGASRPNWEKTTATASVSVVRQTNAGGEQPRPH